MVALQGVMADVTLVVSVVVNQIVRLVVEHLQTAIIQAVTIVKVTVGVAVRGLAVRTATEVAGIPITCPT